MDAKRSQLEKYEGVQIARPMPAATVGSAAEHAELLAEIRALRNAMQGIVEFIAELQAALNASPLGGLLRR